MHAPITGAKPLIRQSRGAERMQRAERTRRLRVLRTPQLSPKAKPNFQRRPTALCIADMTAAHRPSVDRDGARDARDSANLLRDVFQVLLNLFYRLGVRSQAIGLQKGDVICRTRWTYCTRVVSRQRWCRRDALRHSTRQDESLHAPSSRGIIGFLSAGLSSGSSAAAAPPRPMPPNYQAAVDALYARVC